MGRPKALLPIDGRPAVEQVVQTLVAGGCAPVVVVIGRHADEIEAEASLVGVTVVRHAGWATGRTSSIQAGLAALAARAALSSDAAGVVLALVDMPYVRAATVTALIAAFEASRPDVAIAAHGGRRGHPIVLSAAMLPKVRALGPDQPLRDVVRAAASTEVAVDDPGVLVDLNTPEDLAAREGVDSRESP